MDERIFVVFLQLGEGEHRPSGTAEGVDEGPDQLFQMRNRQLALHAEPRPRLADDLDLLREITLLSLLFRLVFHQELRAPDDDMWRGLWSCAAGQRVHESVRFLGVDSGGERQPLDATPRP